MTINLSGMNWRLKPLLLPFLIITALYGLFYFISFAFGSTLLGLILLFYFPGRFIIELCPDLELSSGFFGKFSLSIIYSFCLSSISGLLAQKLWGFNSNYQILAVVILNILLFTVSALVAKAREPKENKISPMPSWQDFLPLAILAAAILSWIALSPLAQNADNFLVILQQSVAQNLNLLISRRIFISFLNLTSNFLNLSDIIVYRYILVALFFSSTIYFYDYLKRSIQSKKLVGLLYLSLLSPAIVLAEINNIRPQVVLLTLTIPILIMLTESFKKKMIFYSVVAVLISGISFLFHELSFTMLFVSFICVIIHLFRLAITEKKIPLKYILLSIIIIYPYIYLFNITSFIKPITGRFHDISTMVVGTKVVWQWWFINHYVDADGVIVSFVGKNVLFYYLYNGIILLILLAYSFVVLLLRRLKAGLHYLPATLYLIVFILIAEIFPRIGWALLPSRAWIHLVLAAIILSSLTIEELEKNKIKLKILPSLMIAAIIIGLGGSLYVAKTNIKQVNSKELTAANFIRSSLPPNSIVISSQDNIALVSIYANQKHYGQISVKSLLDRSGFDKLINSKLEDLSKDQVSPLQPKLIQTTDTIENNILLRREIVTLQPEVNRVIEKMNFGDNPVYFIYSFRKLTALNTADQNRQESADPLNKETYASLGYEIVFQDQSVIIIRIR